MFAPIGNHPAGRKLRDLPSDVSTNLAQANAALNRAERHLGNVAAEVEDTADLARIVLALGAVCLFVLGVRLCADLVGDILP